MLLTGGNKLGIRTGQHGRRIWRHDLSHRCGAHGLTLVEVLISLFVLGVMMVGIIAGYMQSHRTAEWSCYSLAAQSLAMQPVEQVRSATWDLYANPPVDQTTNVAILTTNILDIPISQTNIVWATNRVVVRTISANPPMKSIYVETTWRFMNRGVFTNSVLSYRAPDQ